MRALDQFLRLCNRDVHAFLIGDVPEFIVSVEFPRFQERVNDDEHHPEIVVHVTPTKGIIEECDTQADSPPPKIGSETAEQDCRQFRIAGKPFPHCFGKVNCFEIGRAERVIPANGFRILLTSDIHSGGTTAHILPGTAREVHIKRFIPTRKRRPIVVVSEALDDEARHAHDSDETISVA